MRGMISLDLILTGIFVLGMFGISSTLVTHALKSVEYYLSQPVCRMYAQNLADAASVASPGTVSVVNLPPNIVSATVSGGKVRVEVNGITGIYSCEVKIP